MTPDTACHSLNMGIIEKLNKIGIQQGQPADILLNSQEQVRLIQDYGIDTKTSRFTKYRCIVAPNSGKRKYRTPVFGHNRESRLPASSLQLGIFNLLYFEHVLPLDPIERRKPKGSFELKLFKISEDRFNLKDLVSRYNLQKVYTHFLALDEKSKKNRAKLIEAYESKTYQEFLKMLEVSKKAFINDSIHMEGFREPQMEVIENSDDASWDEFEYLMTIRSEELETQKSNNKEQREIDSLKESLDT